MPIRPPHAPNRLARESSPYLLQHAHNPVDWFPWGDEAFREARARGVPIFLSVGYSTCYWCHVMERESFEDPTIAATLNERFVCVKVDREERPDVDEIFMAALVIMSGHGGWPMSCFLEPLSLRPFWCGTYFPPRPMPGHAGRPTFPQVLDSIHAAWRDQRDAVLAQAADLAAAVHDHMQAQEPEPVTVEHVVSAISSLTRLFDRVHAGFGTAPKFPQPAFLEFLLDARAVVDDASRPALDEAIRKTLDRMGVGGVRDQLAGGFHRYSVDASWTVPHFEKMLYDNALLAETYARAAHLYDDAYYARVARETLDFLLREMRTASGAFLAAMDAEVDGREGKSFVWTPDQVRLAIPDPHDARFALESFGPLDPPNFIDPHHPSDPHASVLRLADRPDALARESGMTLPDWLSRLDRVRSLLRRARDARPQPRIDNKVLTAWNALAISALAHASAWLREPAYLDAARQAAHSILRDARRDGTLLRSTCEGVPGPTGVLEDHAYLARALLALARHDDRSPWLASATEVLAMADTLFADERGRYHDARADRPDLFIRARSLHDGALPSASSVMLHNWIDLADIARDESTRRHAHERARASLAAASAAIATSPVGSVNSTRALLRLLTSGAAIARTVPGTTTDTSTASGRGVPTPTGREFTPVEVYASIDRVAVGPDLPAQLTLLVRVAPGYHIIAADPSPYPSPNLPLTPLRVQVVGGGGLLAYADYPPGEELAHPGSPPIRVHTGEFELPLALEAQGDWTGRPILALSFQACRDTECLRPMTVEIDVALDRALSTP
jgi:uncharacterized protein YyaL (SSP411 family)